VARDHQHRDRRIAPLDLVEQLEPVEPRALQPHVEQHQADGRARRIASSAESLSAAPRGLIAFVLEHAGDQFADVGSSSTTRISRP
jgi:hypothetical protein